MMLVVGCITQRHNLWLVLLAAVVCIAGSWAVIRLFHRARETAGLQRIGWHFLAAVAAGAAIWCTHFIAMLGYRPGVPVSLDPILTVASLIIAVGGAAVGFVVATASVGRLAPAVGGGIVGLAISAMHYTGMMAYRVEGFVSWSERYAAASVALAVLFSAVALDFATRRTLRGKLILATGALVIAIVSLHFTAMAAFRVAPAAVAGDFTNPAALQALALAVAGVALIIVGAGISSYLIDGNVRAANYARLCRMAMSDHLTGLPNRAGFNDRLDFELKLAADSGTKVALIGIDLDRFKEINDLRGHSVGDEVLKTIGERLHAALRAGEYIARVGGDEFTAIKRFDERSNVVDFLTRLESAVTEPIPIEEFEVTVGGSLGVALYPDDAATKEALVVNADLAMYRAKSALTQTTCFYESAMDQAARARRSLTNDLREALKREELDIHYQVQISIGTGEISGFEALVRWKHPDRGFIPPAEFIPLAEENGLILQIGEWVLRTVCAKAATWDPPYKVAVNLSPLQLAQPDLPKLILEVLVQTELPPHRLELELTETAIFGDREGSLSVLRQIKALGVSVALDDFGTGYSSLDILRAFAFDKIKLDRSFMHQLEVSPQAKAIVRAVMALGKSLKIPVLAEGIETKEQLSLVRLEGCDEAQGYFFGRPAPLNEFVDSGKITLSQPVHNPISHEAPASGRPEIDADAETRTRVA